MKVHIDIDCSAEEARRVLGLPDLQPMHDAVLKEMQDRLIGSMRAMDPETLWKTWMPASSSGMEQLRQFWSNLGAATSKDGGQRG